MTEIRDGFAIEESERGPDARVWEVTEYDPETGEPAIGPMWVTFDRKTIFNLWTDYPYKMTEDQQRIIAEDMPYWATFFAARLK